MSAVKGFFQVRAYNEKLSSGYALEHFKNIRGRQFGMSGSKYVNVIRHNFHAFYNKIFVSGYVNKNIPEGLFCIAHEDRLTILGGPHDMVVNIVNGSSAMYEIVHTDSITYILINSIIKWYIINNI